MEPDITKPTEKGTSNGRVGSRLRRFLSRRATPDSSSPEAARAVVVEKKEDTKVVADVIGGEGASPAGGRDEREDSHEDGDIYRAEEGERKEDEDEAADDTSRRAGINTRNDSGSDADDDTGDDSSDNPSSAKRDEASGPLPSFWEKAWNSEKVGKHEKLLLQGILVKPAGSGKKPGTTISRASPQKVVIDGVIKNTQERMASYTARWGSGDDDKTPPSVARSILLSAQTAKTLLDSIVQFDPTGYGSAAWAVISFSLTLVKNDKDLMELTFEACNYLADLMALCARIEATYRESMGKRDKSLERALVSVYVAILVYAAKVQESNAAKTWTRIKKSIVSLTGQPLEDLKMEIENEMTKLEKWEKVIDRERAGKVGKMLDSVQGDTEELLKRVVELTKDTEKMFQKMIDGIKGEELRELWKSLRDMEGETQFKIRKGIEDEIAWWKNSEDDQQKGLYGKSKARPKKRRGAVRFEGSDDGDGRKSTRTDEEGSDDDDDDDDDDQVLEKAPEEKVQGDEFGGWLFQTQEYSDWIKYPQGVLWLHGNSGCGKSALCAAIIKNLKERYKKTAKTKIFASWHFRFDIDESKRLNSMLVSLLRQLASKCKGYPDEKSFSAVRGYQDDGELPTETKEPLGWLKKFIHKIDKEVFLVLDGVDQCPDRQGMRDSDRKLLDIIKELAHRAYPNLHILVVSRDEKDIRLYFEKNMQEMLVSVDVRQGLREALDTLINRKLESTTMATILKGDQNLKKKIEGRLGHDRQASNFLWASSVLRQVFRCRNATEIEQVLGKIPDSINTRYQTALSKLSEGDKERMKRILLWLRWQERSLSQAEFVAVADVGHLATVTEICSRVLIETAKERIEVAGRWRTLEVFRFTHFSVREYLDAPLTKEQEALNKSTKTARFGRFPAEEAHLQITRRCLEVLRVCALSPRPRTTLTAKTGSDMGWYHDADALSDMDDASQNFSATDDDSDASGVGAAETDSEDDRQSTSTGSSIVDGGCYEWPARRYAAEHWFRHYANIDRKKLSNESLGQLGKLESEICSEVLKIGDIMYFWLSMYDPDGGANETIPSPVYYAVKLNLEEIPMRLIASAAQSRADTANGVDILDQPGADGTALQLVAHQGDLMVLEELIKHKVNVNFEKGLHGTAIYASAARGHKGMVEKLLRVDASLDGEDHGDLGSPLHVAAFQGHTDIVELLLREGNLAVDQLAGPFGTALQAASAAGHSSTVKLLLDEKADPNVVSGCLGTAAQAALAYDEEQASPRDAVIDELRSRDAQFSYTPSFWSGAYERAKSELSELDRIHRHFYWRMLSRETSVTGVYETLLRNASSTSWLPREVQLRDRQGLLASVIVQWTLPMAQSLDSLDHDPSPWWLNVRVPFQDQLDAIRRAAPKHEVDIYNLCQGDFMYKAYFWAGINCIMGRLPSLVEECLKQVTRQLDRYEPETSDEYPSVSPVLPFRWALEGFSLHPQLRHNHAWNPKHPDTPAMMNDMDRSDLLAMELMQQRQKQRQLEDMLQYSSLTGRAGWDRQERERDVRQVRQVRQVLASASRTGVWVTSDVLDLVKTLVECGDRCARYQDAVEDSAAAGYQEHVEDLTFELLSTVIRLVPVLGGDGHKINFEKLVQPLKLLTTVRLARIKELDAICEGGLVLKHGFTNAGVEMGSGLRVHAEKMADTIADQVEQVIGDKLTAMKSDMVDNIQRSIREEVAGLMEKTWKEMEQRMRDQVTSEVAKAQAVQP